MVTAGSETRAELVVVVAGLERRPAVGNGGVRDPRRTERGGEPSGGGARAEEWERTMEELDESDIRACGGFLPLGRTGLASGTPGQTENGSGLAGGTVRKARTSTLGSGATWPRRERRRVVKV